jgi:hypothetical protein
MSTLTANSAVPSTVFQLKQSNFQKQLNEKKEFLDKRVLFENSQQMTFSNILKKAGFSFATGTIIFGTPVLLGSSLLYACNLISGSTLINFAGAASITGTILLSSASNIKLMKEFSETTELAQNILNSVSNK